jgi:formyl-CoA transferase
MGSAHRMFAPYQAIRCADGYITLGSANKKTWTRLAQALGRPDLLDKPEYAEAGDRVRNRQDLSREIETVTAARPREHWLRRLEEAGVPCGPILDYAGVFADPQVQERGMVQEIDHPSGGRIRVVGPAVKLSETPASLRRPSPRLGEHTEEVLREIGYSDEQIRALAARGAIALGPGAR